MEGRINRSNLAYIASHLKWRGLSTWTQIYMHEITEKWFTKKRVSSESRIKMCLNIGPGTEREF